MNNKIGIEERSVAVYKIMNGSKAYVWDIDWDGNWLGVVETPETEDRKWSRTLCSWDHTGKARCGNRDFDINLSTTKYFVVNGVKGITEGVQQLSASAGLDTLEYARECAGPSSWILELKYDSEGNPEDCPRIFT